MLKYIMINILTYIKNLVLDIKDTIINRNKQ